MTTPRNLVDQLIRDEGLRLRPYLDTEGRVTIGVGRCLDTNPLDAEETELICGVCLPHDAAVEWIETHGITRGQAVELLRGDIIRTRTALLHELPWLADLDPVRRDALVNMAYNLGVGGLLRFRRMLDALRRRDWDGAAREMLDSRWAEQVAGRARRLARQVRTGEWV